MGVGKNAWFAAANTAHGFVSQFPVLFSPYEPIWRRIYILKGGPGTGKSTFLHRVAEEAEGRGYLVEYFYCSSDPTSLDGIRIPAIGTVLYDGTAPHTADPVFPGAVEELLNLGMFFDSDRLRSERAEITALTELYRAEQKTASRYLSALGEVCEAEKAFLSRAFLKEKAAHFAMRLLRLQKREAEPLHALRFLTANSVYGTVHLPTAEENAETVWYITDKHGSAALLCGVLAEAAERYGVSYTRYADPLLPSVTEGIYFPRADVLYITDKYGCVRTDAMRINSMRFFDRNILCQYRRRFGFLSRIKAAVCEGMQEQFAAAGALHDRLEAYYGAAMDFPAENAYTERFINHLFAE